MCHVKKIIVEKYRHIHDIQTYTITYIKCESGRTTSEKNKLRTYAKSCDGYHIKKPFFYQCDIPWHLKKAIQNWKSQFTY